MNSSLSLCSDGENRDGILICAVDDTYLEAAGDGENSKPIPQNRFSSIHRNTFVHVHYV